jgi:hypothetical protein
MANIKKYKMRRVKVTGGSLQQLVIESNDINVLRFINWGQNELRVSQHSDPQNFPELIVAGNGGTNNMMDPAGIANVWVYAAADVTVGLVECQVEDPMMILAMESVVANLMTSLPAGTAHVGSMSIDLGGNPVAGDNRFPVDIGGATIEASNLYTQVTATPTDGSEPDSLFIAGTTDGLAPAAAGANVSWLRVVTGRLWVSIQEVAEGLVFDIKDRAARLLGVADVSDRAGRDLGKARLMTNDGALVTGTNRFPVELPGWSCEKITAAAAETKQVKAAPGAVALILPVAGVGVTLMDDATAKWVELTAEQDFGAHPIQCDTSINLAFAAAGQAWVIFR